MTDGADPSDEGWYAGVDPGDTEAAAEAIRDGSADAPRDWPSLAVADGHAASPAAYYDALHEATVAATQAAVTERERADDRQLVHAVRARRHGQKTSIVYPAVAPSTEVYNISDEEFE